MFGDANETFNPEPIYSIHNTTPAYSARDDYPTPIELIADEESSQ